MKIIILEADKTSITTELIEYCQSRGIEIVKPTGFQEAYHGPFPPTKDREAHV